MTNHTSNRPESVTSLLEDICAIGDGSVFNIRENFVAWNIAVRAERCLNDLGNRVTPAEVSAAAVGQATHHGTLPKKWQTSPRAHAVGVGE